MARNPDAQFSLTFIDNSAEKSTMKVHTIALDEGTYTTKKSAFVTAARAVSACTYKGETRSLVYVDTAALVGTSQRENKFLIQYTDNGNLAQYSVELPGRDDGAFFTIPGTDFYDLDIAVNPELAALKTAFEAFVVSPQGGSVTVQRIRAVGRNV